MEMKIPVDFERLPEFRFLASGLKERAIAKGATDKGIEGMAVFIVMRLFVELAYAAQSTNRPGLLSSRAEKLLAESLEPLFGEDCNAVGLLKESGILTAAGVCEVFARNNEHLAGNFKSKEVRGAAASALVRGHAAMERDADRQSLLLHPEVFRVKDETGEKDSATLRQLEPMEVQACMRLIKTLDNCLKINGRKTGEYTEGLIADAWLAVRKHTPEQLREFYVWLTIRRDHPSVPERTEQLLAKFEEIFLAREEP